MSGNPHNNVDEEVIVDEEVEGSFNFTVSTFKRRTRGT